MRRFFNLTLFILQLSIFTLLTSCENPLFIEVTELHKVEFSTNGGTSIDSVRTKCIKTIPVTSRIDYTFEGWHLRSDFSDKAVSFPLDIKEDTTLYANWYQQFTVNFECNGGDTIESYKTGLISVIPDTSRANYIFAGWYTKSDFSGSPVNFPYTVTRPTTFYAKWLATYTASFETNGGSVITAFRTAIIENPPASTREGFTFAGWYKDSALTQKAEFPLTLTTDTTFYAKWQKVFTVSFETNGGTAIASIQSGYLETSPVSTKADASLEGWYTSYDFAQSSKVTFPYTVTGDITLYAKWQPVQCTITYYANGASGGSVPASTTVDKGSSYTILGNTGNLEKTGFAFTKWNTRTDGGGQGYSAGTVITVTSDISLYAQWGKDYAALVTVPGGSFYFGDPSTSNRPKITLSSFQIAQYELTYELWLEVATWAKDNGYNLTAASKGYATNDQYKSFVPATNISWNMACVWLNAYSEYKGLEPVYYRGNTVWKVDTTTSGTFSWDKTKNGYRLPTECEWEFAAGGGNETTHDNYAYSGSNTIGEVAWYYNNAGGETHPVGTKKVNALGIYDMSGNVAEWCYDYYADFGTGELTNPVHESGNYGVSRGGALSNKLENWKIFSRIQWMSTYAYIYKSTQTKDFGIRVARNAE